MQETCQEMSTSIKQRTTLLIMKQSPCSKLQMILSKMKIVMKLSTSTTKWQTIWCHRSSSNKTHTGTKIQVCSACTTLMSQMIYN